LAGTVSQETAACGSVVLPLTIPPRPAIPPYPLRCTPSCHVSPPSGTCATTTLRPARSAVAHAGSARKRAVLNPALLSRIVNWLRGVRGTRLPLMPVILGGAPVNNEANPGAVEDGKTAVTSSAKAPA